MINSYLSGQSEQEDHVIHLLFSANRWEAAYGQESVDVGVIAKANVFGVARLSKRTLLLAPRLSLIGITTAGASTRLPSRTPV